MKQKHEQEEELRPQPLFRDAFSFTSMPAQQHCAHRTSYSLIRASFPPCKVLDHRDRKCGTAGLAEAHTVITWYTDCMISLFLCISLLVSEAQG